MGWPPRCRPLVLLAQAVDGVLAAALDRRPLLRRVLFLDEAPSPALFFELGKDAMVLLGQARHEPGRFLVDVRELAGGEGHVVGVAGRAGAEAPDGLE